MDVSPDDLLFTQDLIKNTFQEPHQYQRIDDAVGSLLKGVLKSSDFPRLNVVSYGAHLWSLDNRRLWAFKRANISTITVQHVHYYSSPRFRALVERNLELKYRILCPGYWPRVRGGCRTTFYPPVERNFIYPPTPSREEPKLTWKPTSYENNIPNASVRARVDEGSLPLLPLRSHAESRSIRSLMDLSDGEYYNILDDPSPMEHTPDVGNDVFDQNYLLQFEPDHELVNASSKVIDGVTRDVLQEKAGERFIMSEASPLQVLEANGIYSADASIEFCHPQKDYLDEEMATQDLTILGGKQFKWDVSPVHSPEINGMFSTHSSVEFCVPEEDYYLEEVQNTTSDPNIRVGKRFTCVTSPVYSQEASGLRLPKENCLDAVEKATPDPDVLAEKQFMWDTSPLDSPGAHGICSTHASIELCVPQEDCLDAVEKATTDPNVLAGKRFSWEESPLSSPEANGICLTGPSIEFFVPQGDCLDVVQEANPDPNVLAGKQFNWEASPVSSPESNGICSTHAPIEFCDPQEDCLDAVEKATPDPNLLAVFWPAPRSPDESPKSFPSSRDFRSRENIPRVDAVDKATPDPNLLEVLCPASGSPDQSAELSAPGREFRSSPRESIPRVSPSETSFWQRVKDTVKKAFEIVKSYLKNFMRRV